MTEPLLHGLEAYIAQGLREWGFPGAAVAIVRENEILHARGYGLKDADTGAPVDEHTLFQIGSATKPFTAAALGLLVDGGTLGWDDALAEYLPDFQLSDPWRTREITLRDALAHSGGYLDSISYGCEIMDSRQALRRMRYRNAFAPLRRSFSYSNASYNAAGQVIEAVSGVSWNEFIQTRVFEPLGMHRSRTTPACLWDAQNIAPTIFGTAPAGAVSAGEARDQNIAMPHTLQDGAARVMPWQSYDSLAAAGNLVSSIADLSEWLRLHLNAGTADDRSLLAPETLRTLHTPQNPHFTSAAPFDSQGSAYSLGWFIERYRGERLLSHGGLILGFPAWTGLLPDRRIGIAILANAQKATFETYTQGHDPGAFHKSIALWVFDRLLGAPQTDWQGFYGKRLRAADLAADAAEANLQAARLINSRPTLPLASYVGQYRDDSRLQKTVRIVHEGGKLRLVYPGAGAYQGDLEHWHQDIFRLRSAGVRYFSFFVRFTLGTDGEIAALSAIDSVFRRVA